MDDARVKELEKELSVIESEIDGLKDDLKDAKERFDEKLLELRTEINRKDDQQELPFVPKPGNGQEPSDAHFEVVDGPKALPAHKPLELPAKKEDGE